MASLFPRKASVHLMGFLTALTVSTGASAMERPVFSKDPAEESYSTASAASAAAPEPGTAPRQDQPFEKFPEAFFSQIRLEEKISEEKLTAMAERAGKFLDDHFGKAAKAYETILTAIGPMGPTEEGSRNVFKKAFLKYLFEYIPHEKASIEITDRLGDPWAYWPRISGYAYGHYGYPKNPAKAQALNDSLADGGMSWANRRRVQGYAHGLYGYAQDLEKAREFTNACHAQGMPWATRILMEGYPNKRGGIPDGHPIDGEKARELNGALVREGDKRAMERLIEGHAEGKFGYLKDLTTAWALNESWAARGDEEAIKRRIWGYAEGTFGYPNDPLMAWDFNDIWAREGNEWAMKRRILGFAEGNYGYPKDPEMARTLNDAAADKGHEWAIERRIRGKSGGYRQNFGYTCDPEEERRLRDALVARGNLMGICMKMNELNDRSFYSAYPEFKEAMETLLGTFFPEEPEALGVTPKAAAAAAAGG